jgi:nucleotide-binding universal stress UspA family protein
VKIQTILVPTDFSPDAGKALEWAVDLAKQFGATVHLLHAYQIVIDTQLPLDTPSVKSLWDQVRTAAEQQVERLRGQTAAKGVACQSHVLAQAPSLAAVETAKKIGADLIVMGTRGNTGLKHVLLGSVAERTVRHAHCPVLTVKAAQA